MKNITIAVAGKGGSGKTTFVSLITRALKRNGKGPVLAVDADPNVNLNISLGLEYDTVVSDLREDAIQGKIPSGMARTDYVNMGIHETLTEGEGVDLLVMGKPEGKGCYCAVNNLLRDFLSRLSLNYPYLLIDNEAGMEHLSRHTTNDVDILFLVSDPSYVGMRSAVNAYNTAKELSLNVKKSFLVLTRAKAVNDGVKDMIDKSGMELAGVVPYDEKLQSLVEGGKSVLGYQDDLDADKEVESILKKTGVI